jgi:hypothetical protein
MKDLMPFLWITIVPWSVGGLVIAIAWRTIPGFAERPDKRTIPMAIAAIAATATLLLGVRIWLAPSLAHQHSLDQPQGCPNAEVRGD